MAKEMLASQGIMGGEYFHMAAERSQVGSRGGRRAGPGSGPLPWVSSLSRCPSRDWEWVQDTGQGLTAVGRAGAPQFFQRQGIVSSLPQFAQQSLGVTHFSSFFTSS